MNSKIIDNTTIGGLLDSDVSIKYQVYRDLLSVDKLELKDRIAKEGWGAKFLSFRKKNGHWGSGFYQPIWISSHYTLLDLKNLCISNQHKDIQYTINKIIQKEKNTDGGVNPARSVCKSDVCINGMFLNYATYFKSKEEDLKSVVDFILSQQLSDGGFNCQLNRKGARHSSLHSTLSVIEGILEYSIQGYTYRIQELKKAEKESREFILEHNLFKSSRSGQIIDKRMLMLSYPCRWRYDILKALDYFQFAGTEFDKRMNDAIDVLVKKQRKDKKWPVQNRHSGQTHFEMEKVGHASKWNTLRVLRVLKHFNLLNRIA